MLDKSIYRDAFFIFLLIAVYLILDYQRILFLRPMSIHQWAQCDRASVARNYAETSMNFFEPRTHFLSNTNGITGLEFPMINYLAAICYKLFGFNEAWYRGLMLLCLSIGIFFSYRIALLFIKDYFLAVLTALCWYLSPVLCYYSANFLSDAASLGFIITAWYFYFRYRETDSTKKLLLFFLFAAVASLIKITSFISVLVIALLTLIEYFSDKFSLLKSFSQVSVRRNKIVVVVFVILFLIICWYGYAAFLSSRMKDKIFLVGTNPPHAWSDFPWVWNDLKKLWLPYYYHWLMYIIYGISFAILIFRFNRLNPLLKSISVGLAAGAICFVYLFFNQYRLHDYYIICLLPVLLFVFITSIEHLLSIVHNKKYYKLFSCAVIAFISIVSLWWSRKYLEAQYGDVHFPYNNIEPYMESFGVRKEDKVITLYDNSFNIQLYLMNRKGWRIENGKITKAKIRNYINRGAKFILVNDASALNNKELKPYLKNKTGEFMEVNIFKVD